MPSPAEPRVDATEAARLRTVAQVIDQFPAMRSEGVQPDRWIRRLIYERRIPVRKVGGRVFIDEADVVAFLQGEHRPIAS